MQTSYEELLSALSEQQKVANKIVSTMFPPANVGTLHLERWFVNDDYNAGLNFINGVTVCSWRIYPHQQNTGGFFVAVLERVPKPKTSGTKRPKEDDKEDRQIKKPKLDEEAIVRSRLGHVVVEHSAEGAVAQAGNQEHTFHVEMAENGDEAEKVLKARPSGSYKEEPYTFLDPESEDLKNCL
jgi:multisite-specific tRNA:(cytosine-C5)-methyltransferase